MKAVLALVFFACIAGSMATNTRGDFLNQLITEGQAVAQTVLGLLQQQILAAAQGAAAQISQLLASLGAPARLDINALLAPLLSALQGQINGLLGQVLQGISGLIGGIGGRAELNLGAHFTNFWQSIEQSILGLGQHFLNQGLSAVLGGLGGLGGRGIFDGIGGILASLSEQASALINGAQTAITGVVGNLVTIGSGILDASKPHWEQLQEQLVGHGLNVLGSLSETINNLHGSITGGR
jgi:hypothetical protein